ncbi:hypothetical protein PQZ52_01285 [Flavobacteriales bacterium]|nr:hypothetical protein [Flavobacteriales bacterium]
MSINPDELINIEGMGGITPFERPVAGQSLTNDPDSKYPWEKPPEFTEVQGALMSILADSYEKETYKMLALSIADGMPVGDLTSMILQAGFQEGKWNPDLMLMLIEPTMYILASIAEQCDIDYLLYRGDTFESYNEEDEEEIEKQTLTNFKDMNSKMRQELKFKDLKVSKITKDSVPEEALEVIEDFEPPKELVSLLARKKEESNNSLLERT